jgi:hypothetical protein
MVGRRGGVEKTTGHQMERQGSPWGWDGETMVGRRGGETMVGRRGGVEKMTGHQMERQGSQRARPLDLPPTWRLFNIY